MYPDVPATENAERHAIKLTKRHLVRLFWVLTVLFLFPSVLAAEPSLAETVQYIEAKLSAHDSHMQARSFRLNGRTVNYITKHGRRYTFKLDDLSTRVTRMSWAGDWKIGVSCARGSCILEKKADEVERTGGIELRASFPDGERVQKALIHAIRISGGKDELF